MIKALEINNQQLQALAKKLDFQKDLKETKKKIRKILLDIYPELQSKQKQLDNLVGIFTKFEIEGNIITIIEQNFLITVLNNSYDWFMSLLNNKMIKLDYTYLEFTNDIDYYYNYINGGMNQDDLSEWNRVRRISHSKGVKFDNGFEWVEVLSTTLKPINNSKVEGKIGKHCGNQYGNYRRAGGSMLSLRKMQPPDVKLTVILDKEGYIVESKGKCNTKFSVANNQEELKYLVDKISIVKGNRYIEDRYANYQNFYISDFYYVDKLYATSKMADTNWFTIYDTKMMNVYESLENNVADDDLFKSVIDSDAFISIGELSYHGIPSLNLVISLDKLGAFLKKYSREFLRMISNIDALNITSLFTIMPKNVMQDSEVVDVLLNNINVTSDAKTYGKIVGMYYNNINDIESEIVKHVPEKYSNTIIEAEVNDTVYFLYNNVVVYEFVKDNRNRYDVTVIDNDKLVTTTNSFNVSTIVKITPDGQVINFQNRALKYKKLTDDVISYITSNRGIRTNHLHNLKIDKVIHKSRNVTYNLSGVDFSVVTPISTSIINELGEVVVEPYSSITINIIDNVFHAISPDAKKIVQIDVEGNIIESFEISNLLKTMKVLEVDDRLKVIRCTDGQRTEEFYFLLNTDGTSVISKTKYIKARYIDELGKHITLAFTKIIGKEDSDLSVYDVYDENRKLLFKDISSLEPRHIGGINYVYAKNVLNRNMLLDSNFERDNTYGMFTKKLFVDKVTEEELNEYISKHLTEDFIEKNHFSGNGDIEIVTTINGRDVKIFDNKGNELKVTTQPKPKKKGKIIGKGDIIDTEKGIVNRFGEVNKIDKILNKTRFILELPNGNYVLYNTTNNEVLTKQPFSNYTQLSDKIFVAKFDEDRYNIFDLSGKYKFPVNGNYDFRVDNGIIIAKNKDTDEDELFYNIKRNKLVNEKVDADQHKKNSDYVESLFTKNHKIMSKRRRRKEKDKKDSEETDESRKSNVQDIRSKLGSREFTKLYQESLRDRQEQESAEERAEQDNEE